MLFTKPVRFWSYPWTLLLFQTVMATHCLLNGPAQLINSTLLCICLGTQL